MKSLLSGIESAYCLLLLFTIQIMLVPDTYAQQVDVIDGERTLAGEWRGGFGQITATERRCSADGCITGSILVSEPQISINAGSDDEIHICRINGMWTPAGLYNLGGGSSWSLTESGTLVGKRAYRIEHQAGEGAPRECWGTRDSNRSYPFVDRQGKLKSPAVETLDKVFILNLETGSGSFTATETCGEYKLEYSDSWGPGPNDFLIGVSSVNVLTDQCPPFTDDKDGDGVNNTDDQCPDTPAGETVDANGCSESQLARFKLVDEELDFGQVQVGSESLDFAVLRNEGSACAVVTVGIVEPAEGFFIGEIYNTTFEICPNNRQSTGIYFAPKSVGPFVGRLLFSLPGGNELQLGLFGEGVDNLEDWSINAPPTAVAGEPYFFSIVGRNLKNPLEAWFEIFLERDDRWNPPIGWDTEETNLSSICPGTGIVATVLEDDAPNPALVLLAANGEKTLDCRSLQKWNWVERQTVAGAVAEYALLLTPAAIAKWAPTLKKVISGTLVARDLFNAVSDSINQRREKKVEHFLTVKTADEKVTSAITTVKVSEQKLDMFSDAIYIGFGTAYAGSFIVTVACVESFTPVGCALALAATAGFAIHVYFQRDAAIDPRSDFAVVSGPKRIEIDAIDALPDSNMRTLAKRSLDLAATSEAFYLAFVRYSGAIEAGEAESANRQLNAVRLFAQRIREIRGQISTLIPIVISDQSALSEAEIADLQAFYAAGQLPAVWGQVFDAFGISAEEVRQLEIAVSGIDPSALQGSVTLEDLLAASDVLMDTWINGLPPAPEGTNSASLSLDPATVNEGELLGELKVAVELSNPNRLQNIDIASVFLNGQVQASAITQTNGDADGDGIPDRVITFNADALIAGLQAGPRVLTVDGELTDDTPFSGSALLTVLPTTIVPGDLDNDDDVDRDDLNIIKASLNQTAKGPNDHLDINGDGMITVRDMRKLVLQCTRPRCAIN